MPKLWETCVSMSQLLPPSLKSTQLCLHWAMNQREKTEANLWWIRQQAGMLLLASPSSLSSFSHFVAIYEENVDKLSCLHVEASKLYTAAAAAADTAAATRRRIEVVWARREKLSYAGRASIVTWRKQRKWVEMKMQMRRMFAGHCRGASAGLPPPEHQCSALQLVFSILFPTRNKRKLLNCLLMKQ